LTPSPSLPCPNHLNPKEKFFFFSY
jgi:hypothetical protein